LVLNDPDKSLIEGEGCISFFGEIAGIEKLTNDDNELLDSIPFEDDVSERTSDRVGEKAL